MAKRVTKEEKLAVENKEEKVVLDLKANVKFEFLNSPFHKAGVVLEITGEMANRFIKKGYGKVCND